MKPYLVQIKMSLRLLRRDRAVLFFNYFFPLLFFIIFAFTFGGAKNPGAMAQVVNMVLVLGVLGSGFFGAGIRAVQDRESNILRRYKVAPISPAPIIVSSLVSGLVSFLPSIVLILWLAHGWMKMPLPHRTLELVIFIAVGAVAFRAVGMIVAAVVNSMQESQIVTQMIYLPMLFLSGATFPLELFPHWLKVVSQFIPAYYLFQGMQSIVLGGGSLASNILPLSALVVTLFVALFVGTKLFRWEKEEKIKNSAKLWILVVLAPFFLIGFYQFHTDANAHQAKIVSHNMSRQRTWLIQNARIFVGNGQVIPNGSVLVRNGKIVSVSSGMQTVDGATVIDASGKTLLPGLIDMNVRLGLPGGIYSSSSDYANPKAAGRALAAYLYSGVTAVRSMGDSLTQTLALRASVADASDLGAELFVSGPMFTAPGGYGTEYSRYLPQNGRAQWEQETLRTPKTTAEAKQQVEELHRRGADHVTVVLEAGSAGRLFNRLDSGIYRAIVDEAHADRLLVATYTGDAHDIQEAAGAGSDSIEHGSTRETISASLMSTLREKGIAYDPTLSAAEALDSLAKANTDALDRPLIQQVGPKLLLDSTRKALQNPASMARRSNSAISVLPMAQQNLLSASKAGVFLVAGSNAGSLLVIHGPTIQRELQLWVQAGIPPAMALQAATYNAAKALRADNRIGSIQVGREATLLLVEGDPLQNIADLEHVALVMFRGEQIDRPRLF